MAASIACAGLVLAVVVWRRPAGWIATVHSSPVNIGIPGISKWYVAELRNGGLLPMRIRVCDAVDDTLNRVIGVDHAIERWDSRRARWEKLWEVPPADFCRPYPTGISQARIGSLWIWPGQGVGTGGIAIQAFHKTRIGDHLRFVFYPLDDDQLISVSTPAFVVDERPKVE